MPATAQTEHLPPASPRVQWLGRRLCDVFLLFLIVDAFTKLMPAASMPEAIAQLSQGASVALSRGLSLFTLVCAGLYLSPRTSPLGATLLNGLLGGAIGASSRAAPSQDLGHVAKKMRRRAEEPVDFAHARSSLPRAASPRRHRAPQRNYARS